MSDAAPNIDDNGAPSRPTDLSLSDQGAYISLSKFTLNAARSYYADGFSTAISSSPNLILQPNTEISALLETLRIVHKRRLFVLTNGSWTHCNEVMRFAIGRDWLRYFDLVVTDAKKESFFDKLNETPFFVSNSPNILGC